jgi:hypothetical protein
MKYLTFLILGLIPGQTKSQAIDTMINVGKYDLHFTIIKGTGTPILFEAGGGNDGTIWDRMTKPIAEVTRATVITYDRPGLGKSGIDSTQTGIEKDISGLETALIRLGYQNKIMLVSHSLGGFYNTLYASRHPKEVQAIVFIDANHPCFFSEEQLVNMKASQTYRNMVETVKKHPLPSNIPVVDIVSEQTLFEGTPDADRWKNCHKDFVSASAYRKGLTAYESGHYVFFANRQLVINAIVTLYANNVMPAKKTAILERGYAQEQVAANEDRRSLIKYWHSEDDLNEWGYALLNQHELQKAIGVFKLNVQLHFQSANVYDSLGDAYMKAGNKEMAIINYRRALELNPKNEKAKKVLAQLSN